MAWTPKGNIRGPKGDKGDTGATGATGAAGTAGEKWFTGTVVPSLVVGSAVGDWYLNSSTGDYYECTSVNVWTLRGNLKGTKGDTGAQGSQGIQGVQGPQGPTGLAEVWWSGAGVPPTATGAIGDWYLNTSTADVYEKTGSTTWTLRCNIKGATGNTGSQGPQGATGSQGTQGPQGPTGATGQAEAWWSGSGAPSSGLGAVGDFYLNHADGAVSEKTGSSTWTTRTNIMGPQGPQGPAAALPTVLVQSNFANPAGLAGATSLGKMAGMAIYFTPTRSGMVIINGNGNISVGGAGAVVWASLRYGTGTAPINGSTGGGANGGNPAGTINQSYQGVAGALSAPASFCGVITGLALGVQCWIDVVLTNSGTAANVGITYPYFQIIEQ